MAQVVFVRGYFRIVRGNRWWVSGHVRPLPRKGAGIEVTEIPLSEFEHVSYGGTDADKEQGEKNPC